MNKVLLQSCFHNHKSELDLENNSASRKINLSLIFHMSFAQSLWDHCLRNSKPTGRQNSGGIQKAYFLQL